jgi:hypothetical protein
MGGMLQAAAYQLNQFFVFDPLGFAQHFQIQVGGLTKGSDLLWHLRLLIRMRW